MVAYGQMGRAMNIKGVFNSYEEAERIFEDYEAKFMVFHPANKVGGRAACSGMA